MACTVVLSSSHLLYTEETDINPWSIHTFLGFTWSDSLWTEIAHLFCFWREACHSFCLILPTCTGYMHCPLEFSFVTFIYTQALACPYDPTGVSYSWVFFYIFYTSITIVTKGIIITNIITILSTKIIAVKITSENSKNSTDSWDQAIRIPSWMIKHFKKDLWVNKSKKKNTIKITVDRA